MSPELNDLYLPVEAGLDEVLQHLVLTALTVDVEQVQVPRSSSHIVENSCGLNDFQRNLFSCINIVIFHTKGSLAFEVGLRQENGPSGITQSVVMNSHIPLVSFNMVTPNSLQIFIKIRNWLVNVQFTEIVVEVT